MARLAAAAVLVCSALLLCVGQSAGSLALGDDVPFSTLFPAGSLPPPVRIYCKENTTLNVAARDDGAVVLAVAKFGEFKQLWWQLYPLPALIDGEGLKFWLVNVATRQAIVSPTDGSWEVKLAPFNPSDRAQLWVPDKLDADGFYQIKVFDDESKALNGLWGNVHDGTVVGIYPDNPVSANTLWNLTSIWPFPFHYFH